MSEKFKNKYRVASARLSGYDYSQNGAYFITIVTQQFEHFFGEIVDDEMVLNEMGEIVWNEWFLSEKIRDHIFLDKFVIMPNHVHGIVIIDHELSREQRCRNNVSSRDVLSRDVLSRRDVLQNVSTNPPPTSTPSNPPPPPNSTKKQKNEFFAKISPTSKSLSMMIRQFKSAVTIKSRDIMPHFAWQPRFYDRIIRNENEMNRIRQYIIDNPKMWHRDRNNGELWL